MALSDVHARTDQEALHISTKTPGRHLIFVVSDQSQSYLSKSAGHCSSSLSDLRMFAEEVELGVLPEVDPCRSIVLVDFVDGIASLPE